jgi:hypothetical protein
VFGQGMTCRAKGTLPRTDLHQKGGEVLGFTVARNERCQKV